MKFVKRATPTFYDENEINIDNWHRFVRKIREHLVLEFKNKCAYCESELNVTSLPNIDNFYPKSKYPVEAYYWENLILCCQVCNINKRDYFPLDEQGRPLLINPSIEDPQLHINLNTESGLYEGKTDKGQITITTLGLNRNELVAFRKKNLNMQSLSSKFSNLSISLERKSIKESFDDNINRVIIINETLDYSHDNNKLIAHMLYANIITILETYLSDIFINTIFQNTLYLRKFVETYPKFKPGENSLENIQKFPLSKIFEYYDKINEIVTEEILGIIYHNLRTIKPMFKDTFNVEFPKEMANIYKAIAIRHDIVHRNGKTKMDKETKEQTEHIINKSNISSLADEVVKFIEGIDYQMMKL